MNTEQVVEMIDAISEGRTYGFMPSVTEASDTLNFTFNKNEINIFSGEDFAACVENPRTARELAGALIVWANKQEDATVHPDMAVGFMRLMGMNGAPGKYDRDDCWREKWYRIHAPNMTKETLKVNMRDLNKLKDTFIVERGNGHWSVSDVQKAINICRDLLNGDGSV